MVTAGEFQKCILTLEERYAIKFCFKLGKYHAMKAGSTATTHKPRDKVPSRSMLALPDPRMLDRANPHTNNGMIYMHWVPTGNTATRNTMLRF